MIATASPCIHRRFERQAAQAPHAMALQGPDGTVTYGELNAAANRLARHLQRRGARAGALVALCLERGVPLVTAMLAVLKTGAACVPIDPAYPAARIGFMLGDAEPAVTVTRHDLAGLLPPGPAPLLLDRASWAMEDDANLACDVDGGSLACVLYTSGSTGQPKGVLVEHRQLACHVDAFATLVDLSSRDRVLQFAAPAFDVLAEEVWPTLLHGATLVLRDPGPADALAAFTRQVEARRISVLNLPASFWHAWCDHVLAPGSNVRLAALRQLVVGSEVVHPGRVRAWQARFGNRVAIINAYGPVEATITATAARLPLLAPGAVRVPIGRPLAGTCVRVLDATGNPVAPGTPGELYLGGARLARGYLNRPELTAERFVDIDGERLYRTGDLAALLPDGDLDFLGRIDDQLKVDGHRVEPGDVEACLARHPGVGMAVVAVVAAVVMPGAWGQHLVAYVTPAEGQRLPDPVALQALARAGLPPYMVPAAFVRLATLPLTANGKIDRRKLPQPGPDAWPAQDYDAPQGEAERELAALWCALLKVPRVGRHEDFFALGGDAPTALALLDQLRDRGHHVDMRTLCHRPTVAALSSLAPTQPGGMGEIPAAHDTTPAPPFGLDGTGDQETVHRHVDPALALRLRAAARREGVLPASLFHLAWACVLARGTGRRDALFASVLPPVHGAAAGQVASACTLPLHITLDDIGSAAALRATHLALAALLDRRHVPDAASPRHGPAALLRYRHAAAAAAAAALPPATHALVLTVDDLGDGFRLAVHCAAHAGAGRIGDFMLCALQALAQALERAPATPVAALDVLPPAERAQLARWSGATPFPDRGCLHRLVEVVAARTPHAIAIRCNGADLSYSTLNDEANRLAHYLQSLGVGPDMPVALCLPAGARLVVAALGVLKAGGACMPVDTEAGPEHVATVLADVGATIVLTMRGVPVPTGGMTASLTVLPLDEPGPWTGMPRANPASAAGPAHLAWIAHGADNAAVALEHRNVTRLFDATDRWIDPGADDTWAVCAPPHAGLFVWELWGALVAGARAVIVPAPVATAAALARLIDEERVTILAADAHAFARLTQYAATGYLRHLVLRGAMPPPAALAQWHVRHPHGPRLVALDGTLETGVHATCRPLDPARAQAGSGRIGQPLADVAIHVLDAHGQPAPVGVPGELHIGGAGLARGYVNRPVLTAQRFVPSAQNSGQRLFRTGRQARWLADGTLACEPPAVTPNQPNTSDWWACTPASTPAAAASAPLCIGVAASPAANTPGTVVCLRSSTRT